MKQKQTKKELVGKLKERAGKAAKPKARKTAMCYSPAPPKLTTAYCEVCKKLITDHMSRDEATNGECIQSRVRLIIYALGYDAKVTVMCAECASKLGIKDVNGEDITDQNKPYYVFYFKPKGQEEYHVSISGSWFDYNAVTLYLKNRESPLEDSVYDWHIKGKEEIISRMTGYDVEKR